MNPPLGRRYIFGYRTKVRDVTRRCFIECSGDAVATQRMAEREIKGVLSMIILAVFVSLISEWIADFIRDWLARGVRVPAATYQPGEPGYEPDLEGEL